MSKSDAYTEILIAARDLFSQKGYMATTTKEIAQKAGVNEVTVFRKFESKQKLFESVFEQFTFQPIINIDITEYQGRPDAFLIALGTALYKLFQANLPLINIELRNRPMLDGSVLPLHRFSTQIKDLLERYFRNNELLTEEEVELFSINFMSAVFGLFFNLHVIKNFEPDPGFTACLESLVRRLLF